MKGFITEVQRFSLNDGPGIRTTVFFKGCNLKCAWCHNPETISGRRELCFVPEKCINCFKCLERCVSIAHKKLGGVHRFFPSLCVKCGQCAKVCFSGALTVPGRYWTVEEVMAEIVQDKPYYLDSGGGVTLSGGEVFCQKEFAAELIDACRAEGIAVGVETNLNFPFESIEPVLRKLDLIMFDLKLADDAEHRRWTGAGNGRILENARRLDTLGIPLIARTPLVPGATDSEENLEALGSVAASLRRLEYWELLNFNPLGTPKYHSLNLEYAFENARPLPPERLEELKRAAERSGARVRLG